MQIYNPRFTTISGIIQLLAYLITLWPGCRVMAVPSMAESTFAKSKNPRVVPPEKSVQDWIQELDVPLWTMDKWVHDPEWTDYLAPYIMNVIVHANGVHAEGYALDVRFSVKPPEVQMAGAIFLVATKGYRFQEVPYPADYFDTTTRFEDYRAKARNAIQVKIEEKETEEDEAESSNRGKRVQFKPLYGTQLQTQNTDYYRLPTLDELKATWRCNERKLSDFIPELNTQGNAHGICPLTPQQMAPGGRIIARYDTGGSQSKGKQPEGSYSVKVMQKGSKMPLAQGYNIPVVEADPNAIYEWEVPQQFLLSHFLASIIVCVLPEGAANMVFEFFNKFIPGCGGS